MDDRTGRRAKGGKVTRLGSGELACAATLRKRLIGKGLGGCRRHHKPLHGNDLRSAGNSLRRVFWLVI